MQVRWMLFILSLILLSSCVFAQGTNRKMLYEGTQLSSAGLSASGWGSGTAQQSNEQYFTGGTAIKIATQSYFAGGMIQFSTPIDLKEEAKDPNRCLAMVLYFKEVVPVDPTGGYSFYYDIEPYITPLSSRIRVMLISDEGKMVSAEQITNSLDPEDNWVRMAVPISKFNIENEDSFKVSKMVITSSIPSTIYLGELALLTDNEPIKVEKLDNKGVFPNELFFIQVKATAGFSSLKYSWDFDASNGIQEEWTERIARYIYTKPGDYTITLTVSDADGIKEPVTITCVINVSG